MVGEETLEEIQVKNLGPSISSLVCKKNWWVLIDNSPQAHRLAKKTPNKIIQLTAQHTF